LPAAYEDVPTAGVENRSGNERPAEVVDLSAKIVSLDVNELRHDDRAIFLSFPDDEGLFGQKMVRE
jgi:hypothetical protein